MDVIDKFSGEPATTKLQAERIFPNNDSKILELNIAAEHHMNVLINTIPTFEVVCSPDFLPQLVVGRLITEGIVKGAEEIEQVYVCEKGTRAEVILTDAKRADFNKAHTRTVPTCCTGNKTLNSFFQTDDIPQCLTPTIECNQEWLFSMTRFFIADSPSHKKSYGTHSCYISWKGQNFDEDLPLCCEDLGRHNALDKVIGRAVCAGIDLKTCMLFTSGRVPVDMVTKAVRAKIPILASKAVPTESGIELARRSNLTLICSAYPDSADLICGHFEGKSEASFSKNQG